MGCLHPIYRRILNPHTLKSYDIEVPCGRCINCRHAFERQWEFRVKKTAEASHGFIYDTLTIKNSSFPWIDFSEIKEDGALFVPGSYFEDGIGRIANVSLESEKLLEHYKFKVPIFPKSFLSRWIKLGRERWASFHRQAIKDGKMERLNLRYACVLEYGPKYSRPHVHLMMFGISYADYVRFFAKSWRALYGFTKTKWIKDSKGAFCVSGYLAKYFSKPCPSPLVKDMILPRPWRLISHGIGEEYLNNARFGGIANYLNISSKLFELACNTSYDTEDTRLRDNLCSLISTSLACMDLRRSRSLLDALLLAYDNQYPLSLPRYYKDKLLNAHKKSCAYVAISNYILDFNSKRLLREIAGFYSLYAWPTMSIETAECILLDDKQLFNTWRFKYAAFKRQQSTLKAEQYRIHDENFEKRAALCKDLVEDVFYDAL